MDAELTDVPDSTGSGRLADPADAGDRSGPVGRRSSWVAGFLVFFALLAAWSLATPNYAAPDEPVQAIRAASLVRGEVLGRDVSVPGNPSVQVTVPSTLTGYNPRCFAFQQKVTAACMPAWIGKPGTVRTSTYTGRYPPLYYIAVGLPSLLTTGGNMLLWMRLAGDLVNALFLTAGFLMLARATRPWWAVLGGAAAVTPMVLFIGSVVNPSGLEICAAFALWSALLAWVRAPAGWPVRTAVIWSTVSAVVFESTRGLSPAFLVATVVAVAVLAGWPTVRRLAARRETRVAGAVVVGFGVLALAWVLIAGALRLSRTTVVPANMTTEAMIRAAFSKDRQFAPFVGNFGWLDTPAPLWVIDIWKLAALGLLAGVIASRAWRSLVMMALLGLGTVLLPTVGDVLQAKSIGMVSQARYILPLAIGVALVAGVSITGRARWGRPVASAGVICLAVAQLGAFLAALRRYRFGIGPATPKPAEWVPPFGGTALTVLFVVALLGLQVWLWTLTRPALRVDARLLPSPANLHLGFISDSPRKGSEPTSIG